ncbi:nuclear pore complex protein Nup93-1 [Drosophila grimshawi]|uniref:Nuclear pore protein n=1 Tax=Drosophila grimshawi TaxID=7222 RepID=B4JWX6_DROGR|nr:nuclear pore complex protein Nup93-1 [Drosophila grimshawi]EDV95252.1 GH17674 [Drosophila grimshawi]
MNLNELLQEAQRLANETELPPVERTLSQVLQATQELHSRVTQNGSNDLQAQLLLGSRGVDLPKLTQKVESLSARQSFEPLNPIADTDVDGFLKNVRNNAIIAIIEETNQNIFKMVERNKMRAMFAEWGDEKELLLNAMVGPTQEDFPDVPRHMVSTILPENALPRSRLNRIEALYAAEISEYNKQHGQGNQRFNLLTKLTQLVKEPQNGFDGSVQEMWSVLAYMANVTPLSRTADPIKARQTGQQFVQLALAYLEQAYKKYMNKIIQFNRLVGQRGGIPNVYNTVSSFVTVTFQLPQRLVGLLDVTNKCPLWPLVYYSLRSGDLGAAAQFLKEAGVSPDLLKLIQHKQQEQQHKRQHHPQHHELGDQERPNAKLESQLKLEYSNKLRVCTDPYKKAVYAIVLACDPHEPHPEVVRTIDDFLWMQLSVLATDERPDYHIDRLSYNGLQSLILDKYGENYFNAGEKKSIYFQVLVLTGQFESAIEFLARTAENRAHAVHMAIALNEISMLGTPSNSQQPLLCIEPTDPSPMRRLNLARLIIMYTKCIEQTDTTEAMQYYYLLRHFKANDGRNMMLTCVCDMLVENCDADMITLVFGTPDLNDPWRYVGGIFALFPSMDHDKYTLAGMVGDDLSQRTKFQLAIQLYFIAGQLDKALRLLSSLLMQVVHQPPSEGSMREQLTIVTERMNHLLTERKVDVDEHVMATYTLLSQLLKFFDYYHEGNGRVAAEILAKNRITPNSCAEVDECVRRLKLIGPDIIKVLPDVLLAAMDLIYEEYKDYKSTSGCGGIGSATSSRSGVDNSISESKEERLMQLRQRAKALTNMAATLPCRMSADTNNRLVQLEILMH